jgi:bifunctional oligoribonuclease and PAP phosphatase NrnA
MINFFQVELIDKLWSMVNSGEKILIVGHTNPDGDAMGSVTAMRQFLLSKNKESCIAFPNDYPDYLSFLDQDKKILIYKNNKSLVDAFLIDCDLVIALDFNQLKRIDELEKSVRMSGAKKILIDHHPSPEEGTFDLIISTTETSSTCELLYWLLVSIEERLNAKNHSKLSIDIADSLYVGLMTDTNNFSNSVLSSTFRMASDLLLLGIDKEKLQHYVFGGFTESRMRLLGYLLQKKMVLIPEYGAGYIILTKDEQKKFNFNEGDSEGFVNMPLNIRGINISALFTESEGNIRVSLRSIDSFSVNKLAREFFNGGGHERAAGGKLFIPISEIPSFFELSLKTSFEAL